MPTPWTVIGWAITIVDAVPYWLPITAAVVAVGCFWWGGRLEQGAVNDQQSGASQP